MVLISGSPGRAGKGAPALPGTVTAAAGTVTGPVTVTAACCGIGDACACVTVLPCALTADAGPWAGPGVAVASGASRDAGGAGVSVGFVGDGVGFSDAGFIAAADWTAGGVWAGVAVGAAWGKGPA